MHEFDMISYLINNEAVLTMAVKNKDYLITRTRILEDIPYNSWLCHNKGKDKNFNVFHRGPSAEVHNTAALPRNNYIIFYHANYIILCYIIFTIYYHFILYCFKLNYIILYYNVFYYIILYSIILHCIILYYIILYYNM